MAENIDEDKKILEELTEDTIRYGMVETDAYMAGAITRVLEELETYKKIAEKLAEDLSKHIWLNDKEAILKIYREKVEEDEIYS